MSGDKADAVPKQYLKIAGATVLEHTLRAFLDHPRIAAVVVVLAADDERWSGLHCASHPKVLRATGGARRMDSVSSGLQRLDAQAHAQDWILVHDAARPCFTRADLDRLIAALEGEPVGGLLALPLSDTVKRADAAGTVAATLDRTALWRAQTPQMFRFEALRRAVLDAAGDGEPVTDEASAIERSGFKPKLVEGSARNIKITCPDDLCLAAAILRAAAILQQESCVTSRIGTGYDIHAFGPGDHVMLGGVRIAHDKGVRAHSDGDVVIHALCDALLGAAGLGDIGQHFPDSDPRWKGAASSVFLKHVVELLVQRGYRIVNADITVLAERPRLGDHREAIRKTVADCMAVPAEAVNIKATTMEGLGPIGREEGIAAQAVCLIDSER